MSSYSTIKVDRPSDHVARIRINRPDKLNAVNFAVRQELLEALPEVLQDQSVRVLVLGGVDGNLSAGGDVPSMKGLSEVEARERLLHIHEVCRLVWHADVPVITAAQGVSAGGALGLALLGDFVVADANTKILVPFLKLGLAPDWGLMRSLPLRVGLPTARRLILDTASIQGEEALSIGLADYFTQDGDAMSLALSKAESFARQPRYAVGMVKQRLRQTALFEEDLALEVDHQVIGLTGEEFAEGFAGFTEKRRADFQKI